MCTVEQDEARLLPESKDDLVHHIMNVDEMESEEFPMSPEIIAREQRSTVITYENKIYITITIRKRIVWWYHTYLQHPGITRM
jgi:hypothetical protein